MEGSLLGGKVLSEVSPIGREKDRTFAGFLYRRARGH
jgi:hypothetical protein